MRAAAEFRFDTDAHEYTDLVTGAVLPSITQMLERTGHICDLWYTQEACDRGIAIHKLTSDYDLGALDPETCVSRYRGWLLGHVTAMSILKPTILSVEQPAIHPGYGFGGRPDRVVSLQGLKGVIEIKSGAFERSHALQTALQCLLIAPDTGLPPEGLARFALYLRDNGKFKFEEHRDRRDFDTAHQIIRTCCR